MIRFGIFILAILMSSCKLILLNSMLKDPKVETRESIQSFLETHSFPTENTYILKGDTSSVTDRLVTGMDRYLYVFDKNGEALCYNGNSECSGVQYKALLQVDTAHFKKCEDENEILDSIIAKILPLDKKSFRRVDLPQSDYYVVVFWQKFLGGKKEYAQSIAAMEKEASQVKQKKITIVKINADMQAEWGLLAGEKAKLRWKKNKGSLSMEITDLPISR